MRQCTQFCIIGRLIRELKHIRLLGGNRVLVQLKDLFLLELWPFFILIYTLAGLRGIIKPSSL